MVSVREFVMHEVSARVAAGEMEVRHRDIAEAIKANGGSVSRTGPKLALAELREGTSAHTPRLVRTAPDRYTLFEAASLRIVAR